MLLCAANGFMSFLLQPLTNPRSHDCLVGEVPLSGDLFDRFDHLGGEAQRNKVHLSGRGDVCVRVNPRDPVLSATQAVALRLRLPSDRDSRYCRVSPRIRVPPPLSQTLEAGDDLLSQ